MCIYFACLFCTGNAHATETRVLWLTQLPCDVAYAERISASPSVGLNLFKFDCPNTPPQFISGIIQKKHKLKFIATTQTPRGTNIEKIPYKVEPGDWVGKLADLPVDIHDKTQQSRTPIAPGAPLLSKDFEPMQLWLGGESIVLHLTIGSVFTSLDGVSLSAAKMNQQAKAKTLSGKTLQGTAALCEDKPCLMVKQ
jgi:flagella basal body P-ring formation protein FlgA